MGCLSSSNSDQDDSINKQLDLDGHGDYTETYDPANMSVSRDSTMTGYQFTNKKKNSFKVKSRLNTAIKLSTIPDTENENEQKIETPNSNHNNNTKNINITTEIPLPHKRVIFISIAQLNACIDTIPSYILSDAIFCFKSNHSWFFPSNLYERRMSKQSIRHKLNLNKKFLTVLNEKNDKNLILWLEDNKTWKDISNQLIEIKDIYFENENKSDEIKKYSPLKLDENWWKNEFKDIITNGNAIYCDSIDSVIEEVKESKLKFNPTMELLYQSNPTLIPMRGFDIEQYIHSHYENEMENKNENENETDGIMEITHTNENELNENELNRNDINITPYSPPMNEIVIGTNENMTNINLDSKFSNSKLSNANNNSNNNNNNLNITPVSSNNSIKNKQLKSIQKNSVSSYDQNEKNMVYMEKSMEKSLENDEQLRGNENKLITNNNSIGSNAQ